MHDIDSKEEHMMKKNVMIAVLVLTSVLLGGCGDKSEVQRTVNAEDTAVISKESVTGESVSEPTEQPQSQAKSEETEQAQSFIETEPENNTAHMKQPETELPDGTYTASFTTDSSMFRVSEACDGKGTLTVENGQMTIHISLGSKKIINLYPGLAKDAAKEGAVLLLPTEDTVTYSDGMTEEVYGFDVSVPALDAEFDLALIGTKGKWYDHKVCVSSPELLESEGQEKEKVVLEDGTYSVEITFEGGSGKAQILSPVMVTVTGQKVTAAVQWNSPNYDYMIVDGKKYLPVNTEGDSVFEIPVLKLDEPMDVIGDTVAMSKPHEIEYQITFHSDTAVRQED